MRYPRASAVIVALSTFVAIVTISAVASQLAPLDRAGAVLPEGPITIDAQDVDADADADADADDETVDETAPGVDDDSATGTPSNGGSNEDSGGAATGGDATVVVPAPAETVQPEPEPEGPPTSPGNSGTAPGKPEDPGSHSGQSKP